MVNMRRAGEAVIAITLGILGGLAAAAIINWLVGSKCPACNKQISQGTKLCPYCKTSLEWE